MLRVIYPDARCKKCGGEMTYCHLFDKVGGHHWRIWCEPCYSLYPRSVTEEMRLEHDVPERDALPLYLTYEQRGISHGDPRRKGAFVGSGIGVNPEDVVIPVRYPKQNGKPHSRPRGMPRSQWANQVRVYEKPAVLAAVAKMPTVTTTEVRTLRALPYKEYLQSEHWRKTRDAALQRAKGRCAVCNEAHILNVHHRTYERVGCERPDDLTVLCRDCHALYHHKMPSPEGL